MCDLADIDLDLLDSFDSVEAIKKYVLLQRVIKRVDRWRDLIKSAQYKAERERVCIKSRISTPAGEGSMFTKVEYNDGVIEFYSSGYNSYGQLGQRDTHYTGGNDTNSTVY